MHPGLLIAGVRCPQKCRSSGPQRAAHPQAMVAQSFVRPGANRTPNVRGLLDCGSPLRHESQASLVSSATSPQGMLAKLEAARAGRAMQGERRVVTMLSCDVVGSTAMPRRSIQRSGRRS